MLLLLLVSLEECAYTDLINSKILTLFTPLREATEPIALPGSALTDVAWDAGLWNWGIVLALWLGLCSATVVLLGTTDPWRTSGTMGDAICVCGTGTGIIVIGEQNIGDAGKTGL